MTKGSLKYDGIVNLLRKSRPSAGRQAFLEDIIIEQIERKKITRNNLADAAEFLFAWTYIPWVRRSLVAASLIMVVIFLFQQATLINQVRNISRQVIVLRDDAGTESSADLGSELVLYKLSDRYMSGGDIRISGKELEKIIKAYDELDGKYQGLLKIIEENPNIRNYVEKKLKEQEKNKPNL